MWAWVRVWEWVSTSVASWMSTKGYNTSHSPCLTTGKHKLATSSGVAVGVVKHVGMKLVTASSGFIVVHEQYGNHVWLSGLLALRHSLGLCLR